MESGAKIMGIKIRPSQGAWTGKQNDKVSNITDNSNKNIPYISNATYIFPYSVSYY